MKTPLLNPGNADIWIKPYRADDSSYVKVISNKVYVTDGWYMLKYTCSGPTLHKSIHIAAGYWEYALKCDINAPDGLSTDLPVPPGPIEIVE